MEKRTLTCIGCPMGCQVTVDMQGGEILSVSGYTCKRGERYARREVVSPTRVLTTTLPVEGGACPSVAVKTAGEVPKSLLQDCVRALSGITVKAPVAIGDTLVHDILGTGIDIVAASAVPEIN